MMAMSNYASPLSSTPLRYFNIEPSLDMVLGDPIVRLLMECDGVKMATLLLLIGETQ